MRLRCRVRASGGPWTPVDEEVAIVWRTCRVGGARPFFACPGCGAEVLHPMGRGYGSSVGIARVSPTPAGVREDAARDRKAVARALAIIAKGGRGAFAAALETLSEDLQAWWGDVLEDALEEADIAAENGEEDDGADSPLRADAASLKRFLETSVADWLKRQDAELDARPAIRRQAHGQSFDAFRLAKLYEIDSRLDRQFEKTLAMLIRLQELRAGKAERGR